MKIFIDPGHNYTGADTGATGYGANEQTITYHIAKKLRDIFVNSGVAVKMSREQLTDNVGSGSVNSSLQERCNMANAWDADIFISIHCNASNGSGHGCETYYYKSSANGKQLATSIQTYLAADTRLTNRGVKTNNLYVLSHTNMPAVLVETAFIDNTSDNAYLVSESGQDTIAWAIAKGAADYLHISLSREPETPVTPAVDGEMIYNYIDDNMPSWAKEAVQWAVDNGLVVGTGEGLNLNDEKLWSLTVLYRYHQKFRNI